MSNIPSPLPDSFQQVSGVTLPVLFQNSTIGRMLGANDNSYGFWTTDEYYTKSISAFKLSDQLFEQGDIQNATSVFMSIIDPHGDESTVDVITTYLNNSSVNFRRDNSDLYDQARCAAFGSCDNIIADNDNDDIKLQKRAAFPWLLSKFNKIGRRFLGDLAQSMLAKKFGDYLRGDDPRSYGYEGAYISWHHPVPSWNPNYAAYVINDGLSYSSAAELSMKALANAQRNFNPEDWCLSNRPKGC